MKDLRLVLVSFASLVMVSAANAVTVSQWTFETAPPADLNNSTNSPTVSADLGAGTASGFHTGTGTDWSTPAGNGSANSFSANTWAVNDYWQFQLSTVGFIDLFLAFDQTSSGTGPREFKLAYSTNGTTFSDFQNYSVLEMGASPNGDWNATTRIPAYGFLFDLSSIAAIENTATVYFRLIDRSTVSANGGTVAATGTDRVDNVLVTGTAIGAPVPESGLALGYLLATFGAILVLGASARNKQKC